jgi:hypothetical protein
MPKLSAIKNRVEEIKIDYQGHEINVTYRPSGLSTQQAMELQAADKTDNKAVMTSLVRGLCALVVTWDVLGDDGQPLPVEEDVILATFPPDLVILMANTIGEHNRPNAGKSDT